MQIAGSTAFITGGASGLGAATARHLASLGAQVGVLDRDGERGAATASYTHLTLPTSDLV